MKAGVLISGRGSNLQALIDAAKDPSYPGEIALVISNVADAMGLERARAADIATQVFDHKAYPDRESFDADMTAALEAAGVQFVCLAGFMRLLSSVFVNRWRDRLINIHPSLLPSFKGINVHERVLEHGTRITGCTVHFVRPEMDTGPVIVQAAVPVSPDDTVDTLAARVLESEHRIYPLALRLIAEGRVRVTGDTAMISGARVAEGALLNPVP
jgi:phosphoribosylglycinamide formyltransferase-1